jgi:hypothetical protein
MRYHDKAMRRRSGCGSSCSWLRLRALGRQQFRMFPPLGAWLWKVPLARLSKIPSP